MAIGFYAGSFDPWTYGHMSVLQDALAFCDTIILAIGFHPDKKTLFSLEERLEMLKMCINENLASETERVEIISFEGLAIEAARQYKANLLIRGVRSSIDFEYELQMADLNKQLASEIKSVFLPADAATRCISSTYIRQIAAMGGSISSFVPANIAQALYRKFHMDGSKK